MKQVWSASVRVSLCALALAGTSWVHAQAAQPAEHAMPMHQGHPVAKKMHKPHSKQHSMHDKADMHHKSKGEKSHHAEDAEHDSHTGALNEYERNALRRCEVFKTPEDRTACVARVRQPSLSGSVESGGLIRQTTQPVTAPMHQHPMQKSN